MSTSFAGDKKKGQSILGVYEKKFINWAVPKIPRVISSEALTYSTVVWCAAIVGFSYLAEQNIGYLWLVSVAVFLQWLTDSLDGAVGRYRNTGLIKWGYYMDHFLDYIFLCSILIGYALLLPDHFKSIHFFVLAIMGAFMVNSFLSFAATNEFKISYLGIGPTEVRLIFILINTLIIIFGKTHLAFILPYILIFSFCGLCVVVYRTSKYIWGLDMAAKEQSLAYYKREIERTKNLV